MIIWRNPTVGYPPRRWPRRPQDNGRSCPPGGCNHLPPNRLPPRPAAVEAARCAGGRRAAAACSGLPAGPRVPLRTVVSEETARKLGFGKSPDGTEIGPDDFASDSSVSFEVPLPQGVTELRFPGGRRKSASDRDQVFRITITDREDGGARGIPTRAFWAIPKAPAIEVQSGRAGIGGAPAAQFAQRADAGRQGPDPATVRQHLQRPRARRIRQRVKYIRGRSVRLREHARRRHARSGSTTPGTICYASFEYHDNYLRLIAEHYKLDLKGKHIGDLTKARHRRHACRSRASTRAALRAEYDAVRARAGRRASAHMSRTACEFASRAWRRPLTEKEKQGLRAFYDKTITAERIIARPSARCWPASWCRPAFLYRVEQPSDAAAGRSRSTIGKWPAG